VSEIKKEVNEIIKSFYKKDGKVKKEIVERFKDETVNWADLKCRDVGLKYVVYIGEASPDCYELKEYIEQKLKEKGRDKVEIVMEW
jgi:hypothetical protein